MSYDATVFVWLYRTSWWVSDCVETNKQGVVSKSTSDAKYRAMSFTSSKLKWVRELLSFLGVSSDAPMHLFCDNQAALHIAANPMFHERIKHIKKIATTYEMRSRMALRSLLTFILLTNSRISSPKL